MSSDIQPSPAALDRARKVRDIQSLIEGVTEETVTSVAAAVAAAELVKDSDGVEALAHLCKLAAKFRSGIIELLTRVVIEISKSLASLHAVLLAKLTENEPNRDPCSHFFLYCLVREGYFQVSEVFERYKWYRARFMYKQFRSLYYWFAPEFSALGEVLPDVQPDDDYATDSDFSYLNNKDELAADDWKVLKERRNGGNGSDPLFAIVMKDDVDALKGVAELDVNHVVAPSCYNRYFQLQNSPCLIHLAAFFGARKCAQYLLEKGAELKTDEVGRTVAMFLGYGGNVDMIDLFPDQDYTRLFSTAAAHHRPYVREKLLEMGHPSMNVLAKDPRGGTVLHQVCGTGSMDGILYCFEHGANPLDANKVCSSFIVKKRHCILPLCMDRMR